MANDVISGHRGRFAISGVPIRMAKWTAKTVANKISRGDFESRFKKTKTGLLSTEVTVSGYFDEDEPPFSAFDLLAGSVITAQAFLVKGGLFYDFPELAVIDTTVETDAEGTDGAMFTFTCETDGEFDVPGNISGAPGPFAAGAQAPQRAGAARRGRAAPQAQRYGPGTGGIRGSRPATTVLPPSPSWEEEEELAPA